MIEPRPRCSMPGRKALMVRYIERTLRSNAKLPLLFGRVEHGAGMHEAGGVEQHVDRAGVARGGLDRGRVEHVEPAAWRMPEARASVREQRYVDVGGDHASRLRARRLRQWLGRCLGRGGEEGSLALQSCLAHGCPFICVSVASNVCLRPGDCFAGFAEQSRGRVVRRRSTAGKARTRASSQIHLDARTRFDPAQSHNAETGASDGAARPCSMSMRLDTTASSCGMYSTHAAFGTAAHERDVQLHQEVRATARLVASARCATLSHGVMPPMRATSTCTIEQAPART